jgi:hypothetical protein
MRLTTSTEVKNGGVTSIPPLPHISKSYNAQLIKHRDNLKKYLYYDNYNEKKLKYIGNNSCRIIRSTRR